jgi:hypothetical protein
MKNHKWENREQDADAINPGHKIGYKICKHCGVVKTQNGTFFCKDANGDYSYSLDKVGCGLLIDGRLYI